MPAPQRAKPPKWLPKELHREFRVIGKQLIDVGLYTDLDADNLGRYLVGEIKEVCGLMETFIKERPELWNEDIGVPEE